MGFDPTPLGFNEPTLTTLTFVSYLLAFMCYAVHLLAKSSSVAHVASGRMALAGAGGAVTSDVLFSGGSSGVGGRGRTGA